MTETPWIARSQRSASRQPSSRTDSLTLPRRNAANEPLKFLALGKELTAVSSFEVAGANRSPPQTFHHEFWTLRGVLHVGKGAPTLSFASTALSATALEILTAPERRSRWRSTPLSTDSALVAAAAKLHEQPTGLWHGACSRTDVITRTGLVIVDTVSARPLDHLRFSQERYWRAGIALRRQCRRTSITPCDTIGMVALALILGQQIAGAITRRGLGDADGAAAVSSTGGRSLPPAFRLWLFRHCSSTAPSFASALTRTRACLVGRRTRQRHRGRCMAFVPDPL